MWRTSRGSFGVVCGVVLWVLAGLNAAPAEADPAPGCGCDIGRYHEEIALVRARLEQITAGTSDEARATIAGWGVNPCTVGPLAQTSRYAFDVFGENENKCHDRCSQDPWVVSADAWERCNSARTSACWPKSQFGSMANPNPGGHCPKYGTDLDACRADPLCQVQERAAAGCASDGWSFLQNGQCYGNSCGRAPACAGELRNTCTVNCNDCQNLILASIRNMSLRCFDAEQLESYSISGNHAKQALIGPAGTHSFVKLKPKPGSVAELMAPEGFAADSWGSRHFRRITSSTIEPGDATSVDRERLTLTPEEDDFSLPLEMLPHYYEVDGHAGRALSSRCAVGDSHSGREGATRLAAMCLVPYYSLVQQDYCEGKPGAPVDYGRTLQTARDTTRQFASELADE